MDLLRYSYNDGRFVSVYAQYSDNKNNPITPPYSTPYVLPSDKLKSNEYWAFLDEQGNVPVLHKNGAWVKKIEFESVTAYHKLTRTEKTFDDKTLVTDDYTTKQPHSSFDEWDGYQWVTNVREQYVFDFNSVDNRRRQIYSQSVDPLMREREIKLSQAEILESEGNIAEAANKRQEAKDYQIRALQLREKIQKENPYPINPDA